MNVDAATMTIPYGQAHTAYLHYRKALVDKRATRDDKMLLRGLRAVLRGQKVIDVNLAIGTGGRDMWGRPRLAIGRADWPFVQLHGRVEGFQFSSRTGTWGRPPRGEVVVPETSFAPVPADVRRAMQIQTARAQTPSIPPQFRPADGTLADHHLLFEAVWQPAPTRDPLLLKHIDGPFYVVLAAWDLTPLEQAILRMKL
jgi:hypothetical protein